MVYVSNQYGPHEKSTGLLGHSRWVEVNTVNIESIYFTQERRLGKIS